MSRRPANITQADIARTCRALQACGYTIARVVTRADGVAFETDDGKQHNVVATPPADAPKREVVL